MWDQLKEAGQGESLAWPTRADWLQYPQPLHYGGSLASNLQGVDSTVSKDVERSGACYALLRRYTESR